jgi:hypothetical protein
VRCVQLCGVRCAVLRYATKVTRYNIGPRRNCPHPQHQPSLASQVARSIVLGDSLVQQLCRCWPEGHLVNWPRTSLMIFYCQLYTPGSIQHLPTYIEGIESTQTCHVKRAGTGEAIVCLHALCNY